MHHSSLLLDVWHRWLNAALAEEQQRSLYTEAAGSTSASIKEASITLGLSSRFASLREDAAFALLDRISQSPTGAPVEGMEDSALLTTIATSDQLPLFVRSPSLFPKLTSTLAQLGRGAPAPSTAATAVASFVHRLLHCSACEKEVQSLLPVEEESMIAPGWSLTLSLAYLIAKGFHPAAVDLLFAELQTHPSFRSMDVGLELVRAHLTDAAKKAGKEGNNAALDVYQSAIQLMDAESLGKPAKSASKPTAQPVKARKR